MDECTDSGGVPVRALVTVMLGDMKDPSLAPSQNRDLRVGRQVPSRSYFAHQEVDGKLHSVIVTEVERCTFINELPAPAHAPDPSPERERAAGRLYGPRQSSHASVEDILQSRVSATPQALKSSARFWRQDESSRRRKLILVSAGGAVLLALFLILFLKPSGEVDQVRQARPTLTPTADSNSAPSTAMPSTAMPKPQDNKTLASFVARILSGSEPDALATKLRSELAWTQNSDPAVRELSSLGDEHLVEVCTISKTGAPLCRALTVIANDQDVSIREIVQPASNDVTG
jgi:hypothetical protein